MMRRTRWQTLALLAVATAFVVALLLRVLASRGFTPPPVPLLVAAVLLVIAGVVLSMGWAVRQYQRGKRPLLDPERAARTAVLAKASAITGALLTGWYGGQILVVIGDLGIASQRDRAIAAAVAAVCSIVLAGVGLVVEWFCSIPPPGDDAAHPSSEVPDPAQG